MAKKFEREFELAKHYCNVIRCAKDPGVERQYLMKIGEIAQQTFMELGETLR